MSFTAELLISPKTATDSRASGPFILGDPVHHIEGHCSSSFQSINVAATEPLDSSTPASQLQPEPVSGRQASLLDCQESVLTFGISHYSAPSSPSHTPPGSPPMPGGGMGEYALKHTSTPETSPPCLGLLDPILIREYAALDEDSPCAFGKPDRTRRPNHYRAYTRRRIPRIDYGLPEDFSAYLLSGLFIL